MEGQASVYKVGFWAAASASVCSVAYDLGQLVEWLGLLGSGGGPESDSTWYGLVVLLVPSLFLGISFVVLMGSVHLHAPRALTLPGSTIALVFFRRKLRDSIEARRQVANER